jgi:hypothetical protein
MRLNNRTCGKSGFDFIEAISRTTCDGPFNLLTLLNLVAGKILGNLHEGRSFSVQRFVFLRLVRGNKQNRRDNCDCPCDLNAKRLKIKFEKMFQVGRELMTCETENCEPSCR